MHVQAFEDIVFHNCFCCVANRLHTRRFHLLMLLVKRTGRGAHLHPAPSSKQASGLFWLPHWWSSRFGHLLWQAVWPFLLLSPCLVLFLHTLVRDASMDILLPVLRLSVAHVVLPSLSLLLLLPLGRIGIPCILVPLAASTAWRLLLLPLTPRILAPLAAVAVWWRVTAAWRAMTVGRVRLVPLTGIVVPPILARPLAFAAWDALI
mmetsp:Transcript_24783/g.54370  ORF Transcript_24783/g.54370 Transcript_24783/m.54370 type:complete len:206 (+) Transcript_24783:622-1239(+)